MTEEPTGNEAVATAALANDNRGDFTQGAGNGTQSLDNGSANQPQASAWDSLPPTWRAEYADDWKALPPKVREYVYTRESQVNEGFRKYGLTQKQWDRATEAFKPFLSQNPNLELGDILHGLSQNHLALLQASPEQKREMGLALLKQYGIDLDQGSQVTAQDGAEAGLSKRQIAELNALLSPVLQTVETLHGTHQQQLYQHAAQAVDKFFSDPQNKFAKEVEAEILEVIKSGATRDLGEAYHLAMLRKPEVHAKFIADKAASHQSSSSAAGLPNLKSNGAAAPSAKPATMDDSITSVLQKYYPGYKPRTDH